LESDSSTKEFDLGTSSIGVQLPQTVGVSFPGAQLSDTKDSFAPQGFDPPDSMGAAGPTQFLVTVNGRIKVFDKSGNLGPLNMDLNTFFSSGLSGLSADNVADPRVR